jgi:hypothetical protein
MATFFEKEEKLCNDWYNSYSPEEQKLFCMDGLLSGRNSDPDMEVEKWENARRKVLFFMKDTYDNPENDIREWELGKEVNPDGSIKLYKFYVVLLKWLWALNEVSADYLPVFDKTKEEYIEATWKYPMAQVNIKKISGGPNVQGNILNHYFNRDQKFIYRQVREILNPNIIVCGGGSGLLKNIVINSLYSDCSFEKINDWCYYCSEKKLLVIDSYHPAARIGDDIKFDGMIAAVQEVYKIKSLT